MCIWRYLRRIRRCRWESGSVGGKQCVSGGAGVMQCVSGGTRGRFGGVGG